MARARWTAAIALGLALAGCGGGEEEKAAGANAAAAAANAAEPAGADGGAAMPACPFRDTTEWAGSTEGGRLLVTGRVDLQMAGFRPALTERPGAAPGTLALDLALAPEPTAPVADVARYERRGAPRYGRGEIWCGGGRIAQFDMVHVD